MHYQNNQAGPLVVIPAEMSRTGIMSVCLQTLQNRATGSCTYTIKTAAHTACKDARTTSKASAAPFHSQPTSAGQQWHIPSVSLPHVTMPTSCSPTACPRGWPDFTCPCQAVTDQGHQIGSYHHPQYRWCLLPAFSTGCPEYVPMYTHSPAIMPCLHILIRLPKVCARVHPQSFSPTTRPGRCCDVGSTGFLIETLATASCVHTPNPGGNAPPKEEPAIHPAALQHCDITVSTGQCPRLPRA